MLKESVVKLLGGVLCSTIFAPIRASVVPVFMLHRMNVPQLGVAGHSPEFLDHALSYLSNQGYSFISLAELMQGANNEIKLPNKAVVFTCDDGFADQAEVAAPLLEKYDCPLTIFLITGFIDGELWPWDDRVKYILSETRKTSIDIAVANDNLRFPLDSIAARESAVHLLRERLKKCEHAEFLHVLHDLEDHAQVEISSCPPESYRPMTWDQARALEKRNVQFAPHTVTHAILSKTSDETAEYEIAHSWRRLQEELKCPLPVFCYPTGRVSDFGRREMQLVEKAGFESAVSTTPGYVNIKDDSAVNKRYQLNRFGFPDNMTDLIQYASWIERLKEVIRRE